MYMYKEGWHRAHMKQQYSKLSLQCSHKNFMYIVLCSEELCLKECPVEPLCGLKFG